MFRHRSGKCFVAGQTDIGGAGLASGEVHSDKLFHRLSPEGRALARDWNLGSDPRRCGTHVSSCPSHPGGRLYAPRLGVKVASHEYMGSPPSGRSTLTPIRFAAWLPRRRGNGRMCDSMVSRSFSNGLHGAVEARRGCPVDRQPIAPGQAVSSIFRVWDARAMVDSAHFYALPDRRGVQRNQPAGSRRNLCLPASDGQEKRPLFLAGAASLAVAMNMQTPSPDPPTRMLAWRSPRCSSSRCQRRPAAATLLRAHTKNSLRPDSRLGL